MFEGTLHAENIENIRYCSTGNVRIVTVDNRGKVNITLYDAFHVPNIMYNLIAVFWVRPKNCRIVVNIADGDLLRIILTIEKRESHRVSMGAHESDERLYKAVLTARHSEAVHLAGHAETNIWHQRLGHCNDEILKASWEYLCGINEKDVRGHKKIHCDMRALGKLVQFPCKAVT